MALSIPDPFEVFVEAISFWRCSALVGRNNYPLPCITLESLGLALFLKCMLYRQKIDAKRFKHDIRDLFDALGQQDKDAIRNGFTKLLATDVRCINWRTSGIKIDLDTVIDRANGLFEKARYRYEHDDWSKIDAVNHGVSHLIIAMRDAILAQEPTWRTRVDLRIDVTPST